MNPSFFPRRVLACAGLCLVFAATASAQNVVYAEHKGKMLMVHSAHGASAMVEENGKAVLADGKRYVLRKVEEFLPVFVTVRNLDVHTSSLELMGDVASGEINHTFELRAGFESAFPLKDVFLVLEFEFAERKAKSLFIYEIGQLEPRRRRDISLAAPTGVALGEGHYQIHIFTEGLEVFHSEQPFAFREYKLDAMVAKRIKGVTDANPKPLFGPLPEYPARLAKTKSKGEVTMKFRIAPNGAVLDPVASSASDPALGEAAVAALRQWRFLPKVKAGRPVETTAEMPMTFEAPEKS